MMDRPGGGGRVPMWWRTLVFGVGLTGTLLCILGAVVYGFSQDANIGSRIGMVGAGLMASFFATAFAIAIAWMGDPR